jgi:hypothetical protein
MRLTLLRVASIVGIGGSLLAVAVPAFVSSLSASKLTEAMSGLDRISSHAVAGAEAHPQKESFPPSVELTPKDVPRGARVTDPAETWDHLTWRALDFRADSPHAFSFQFDSTYDAVSGTARFAATAHGDLDGDGSWSTFQIQGERPAGSSARVLPGLLVTRELE